MIAPASTGRESRSRTVVIKTAQTNRGIRSRRIPLMRQLNTVEIKFTDAIIDEAPARWREKIARSTDGPACAMFLDSGGYNVHPVPTPFSTAADLSRRRSDGGRSQNLMLFIRGNAISGADSISGISQFPNPPMKIGITMKKIISRA